jgi:hypothetical protein
MYVATFNKKTHGDFCNRNDSLGCRSKAEEDQCCEEFGATIIKLLKTKS